MSEKATAEVVAHPEIIELIKKLAEAYGYRLVKEQGREHRRRKLYERLMKIPLEKLYRMRDRVRERNRLLNELVPKLETELTKALGYSVEFELPVRFKYWDLSYALDMAIRCKEIAESLGAGLECKWDEDGKLKYVIKGGLVGRALCRYFDEL